MGIGLTILPLILIFAYLILIFVFIFRWWEMTRDIKDIKEMLLKKFDEDRTRDISILNPKYNAESAENEFERLKNNINLLSVYCSGKSHQQDGSVE